jgi:hypothetical protein
VQIAFGCGEEVGDSKRKRAGAEKKTGGGAPVKHVSPRESWLAHSSEFYRSGSIGQEDFVTW